MKWKEYLPFVVEISVDIKYFNAAKEKNEPHEFPDTSEDVVCALAYL